MARIRKFVVSQVEGNDANATNLNEIRPYGEISLFEGQFIDSLQNDRLELLISDGVRTHLRSKVLSPGRFYGYDADSGDGLNRDTIKLIPDADLHYNGGNYGNDQYLVIDPTYGEPGHIHVRAGGNIDQSSADLFLGGEKNHVRVSDLGDYVKISVDNNQPGTYEWTFSSNGNLTLPGSSSVIGESEPGLVVYSNNGFAVQANVGGNVQHNWIFGSDGNLTTSSNLVIGTIPGAGTIIVQDDAPLAVISANANGYAVMGWGESANSPGNIATISFNSPAVFSGAANVSITTGNNGGTQYDWVFGNDGNVTIPGAIISNNNITVTAGGNSFILGTDGGLYVPGDLDVAGASTFNGDITFNGNVTLPGTINQVSGNSGQYFGDAVTGVGALYAGKTSFTPVPDTVFQTSGYINGYIQNNFENTNPGNQASADQVITADNGTDTTGYIDMGMASSGWDGTQSNSLGDALAANDGYLYVQNGTGTAGGHLVLGTTTAGKKVKIVTGGVGAANIVADFSSTGLTVVGNVNAAAFTGNLTGEVTGNVSGSAGSVEWANVSSKPSFANVATSGSYNDLSDKPTIPAAYGNSNVVTLLGSFGSNTISTTGNANTGNLGTTTVIATTGNITTVNSGLLQNGNSNVTITANANVSVFVAGNATARAVFTSTGANIAGTANVTGNITTAANITATGNITANYFVGDGSALTNLSYNNVGNIAGSGANVTLVAGSYSYIFDNAGELTMPAVGGDEGGQINFTVPSTNTTLQNKVTFDIYQNRIRLFEGSANARGYYMDLSKAPTGVGGEIGYKTSGLVNAGTFVTLDNLKATVTSSGNRGLSIASVSGSFSVNVGAWYGGSGGVGGDSVNNLSVTTTASASLFNWNFTAEGNSSQYTIFDKTNSRMYRVTLMIGPAYNSNFISIERL